MAEIERCLAEEDLASYLAGRLSEPALSVLEAHLDACGACAQVAIEGARRSVATPRREQPHIFHVGQRIAGRYGIVAFLGAGGMGEVYEARDEELGARIALKTVSAAATFDERAVARLKAEVLLARKVTHRNVCRIFDFGVHRDAGPSPGAEVVTPFMTMELLEGPTLAQRIQRGPRPSHDEAVSLARQLAGGLRAAHEAGVIHRDFKSDNVLLLSNGVGAPHAVITDFGLAASVLAQAAGNAAMSGHAPYGTRHYLAPERAAGGPGTKAADIYALGMVMREVMTGALAGGPGGATSKTRDLPAGSRLAAIVSRCLEPRPELRPESADAVLSALAEPRPRRLWVAAGLTLGVGLASVAASGAFSRAPAAKAEVPAAPAELSAGAADAPAAPAVVPVVLTTPRPAFSPPEERRMARASMPLARRRGRGPSPVGRVNLVAPAQALAEGAVRSGGPLPAANSARAVEDEPIRTVAPAVPRRATDDDAVIDPFAGSSRR